MLGEPDRRRGFVTAMLRVGSSIAPFHERGQWPLDRFNHPRWEFGPAQSNSFAFRCRGVKCRNDPRARWSLFTPTNQCPLRHRRIRNSPMTDASFQDLIQIRVPPRTPEAPTPGWPPAVWRNSISFNAKTGAEVDILEPPPADFTVQEARCWVDGVVQIYEQFPDERCLDFEPVENARLLEASLRRRHFGLPPMPDLSIDYRIEENQDIALAQLKVIREWLDHVI